MPKKLDWPYNTKLEWHHIKHIFTIWSTSQCETLLAKHKKHTYSTSWTKIFGWPHIVKSSQSSTLLTQAYSALWPHLVKLNWWNTKNTFIVDNSYTKTTTWSFTVKAVGVMQKNTYTQILNYFVNPNMKNLCNLAL